MDSDRKYGQRGYQDNDRSKERREFKDDRYRDERFGGRPTGPKPPLDVTGPRLPRLVQSVAASRCWNCSTTLSMDAADFHGNCPKCGSALHCCKQCTHFEPSTRFQCLKPIPERVNKKDVTNECTFFKARVTVARDTPAARPSLGGFGGGLANSHGNSRGLSAAAGSDSTLGGSRSLENVQTPRSAQDARAAFDSLFKK